MGDSARRFLAVAAVVGPIVLASLLGAGVIAGKTGPRVGGRTTAPLSVSVGPTMAYPTSGSEDQTGLSTWEVDPPVTVHFNRTCRAPSSHSTTTMTFNGHPDQPQSEDGYDPRTFRRGSVWRFRDQPTAEPGEVLSYTVTVRCGSGTFATGERTYVVPAASCFGGPIRIAELTGEVWRYGGGRRGQPFQVGDLVAERGFQVGPGSRVVLAAPECNGFRMVFGPGVYDGGTYQADGRGDAFFGSNVLARGDRHAGSFHVSGRVDIFPLGVPCPTCNAQDPSSYEVHPGPVPDSVRIRVWRGWVDVRVEPTAGGQVLPHARVRAGEEVAALCRKRARPCTLLHVRLFQPGESWSSPLVSKPERLAAVIRSTGVPPAASLAPARAYVQTKVIAAAGGEPAETVVSWSRQTRTAADQIPERFQTQQGVLVWQQQSGAWRLVYRYRVRNFGVAVKTGDVNGDGAPDILIADESAGQVPCATYVLLTTVHRRLQTLLRLPLCNGDGAGLVQGGLEVDHPVGPCPYGQGAIGCYGGKRATYERWRDTRLVQKTVEVTCVLPRLDPKRGCRPRKR